MLRTFHAGKLRNHHGAILAQVQVTPLPTTVVVARRRRAALRARQLMAVLAIYMYPDFLRLMRKRHLGYLPGSLDAQEASDIFGNYIVELRSVTGRTNT